MNAASPTTAIPDPAASLNRVLLLTAPQPSAIAVIRLTGPAVDAFFERHFSRALPLLKAVHGFLRDGDQIIDDAVAVRVDPFIVDLNLHGGVWVVESAVRLAVSAGFQRVDPGLPTDTAAVDAPTESLTNPFRQIPPDIQPPAGGDAPAFHSQIWTEVLTHLPLARTDQATTMLLSQPAAWKSLHQRTAAGSVSTEQLQAILDDPAGRRFLHPPLVAIIGPANVGKSTLANQLFGQERSITADLPGTTRDWVGELANLNGLAVMLIDTPGQRATTDPIENTAISAARGKIEQADLIVLVLDGSKPADAPTDRLMQDHPQAIVVLNKADQPRQLNCGNRVCISTTATTGFGVSRLETEIRRQLRCEPFDPQQPRWWTPRQRDWLTHAITASRGK